MRSTLVNAIDLVDTRGTAAVTASQKGSGQRRSNPHFVFGIMLFNPGQWSMQCTCGGPLLQRSNLGLVKHWSNGLPALGKTTSGFPLVSKSTTNCEPSGAPIKRGWSISYWLAFFVSLHITECMAHLAVHGRRGNEAPQ